MKFLTFYRTQWFFACSPEHTSGPHPEPDICKVDRRTTVARPKPWSPQWSVSGFLTKTSYSFLVSHMPATCLALLSVLGSITVTILVKDYKLRSFSLCMQMAVFWAVALCRLVRVFRRFGGLYCLHHQGDEWSRAPCRTYSRVISTDFPRAASLIALRMEAVQTSETSVNSYPSTRRYNQEDSHLHTAVRTSSHTSHYVICSILSVYLTFTSDIFLSILLSNTLLIFFVCLLIFCQCMLFLFYSKLSRI
jgi:hypothetical protein